MSETVRYNGRIPTDPTTALAVLLALVYVASQLTPDQTTALAATGGIADLALLLLHLARGRR